MLNLYYGRDSLNKERFMFDRIAETEGKTLLLVPDQYTLQAEKEAFYYLAIRAMGDLEVLSLSRLGARILGETGGSRKVPVDERGRYMLVAKILAEQKERLSIYRNAGAMSSFAQMVSDFISEMKQYNTSAPELRGVAEGLQEGTILRRKLEDVLLVFEQYEKYMEEKYLDGEDYITMYTDQMAGSTLVGQSAVWVYGFDWFTPKNLLVLSQLVRCAREVNLVLSFDENGRDEDLFALTGDVMTAMAAVAGEIGAECRRSPIPVEYAWKQEGKNHALEAVEREIFSLPPEEAVSHSGITLVKAANLYSEMETAATYITALIRDKGLKYSEIAVICNDMEVRTSIAKRVFAEYGIELFLDKKRNFMHHNAVRFIVALLALPANGFRNGDLFSLLKTGFSCLDQEQVEELENYAIKYRIKGNRWRSPFVKGQAEYGEERFEALNEARREAAAFLDAFVKPFGKAKTVRERVRILYEFLAEKVKLPEQLEEMADDLTTREMHELAGETAQIWDIIVNIFDQLTTLVGDETLLVENFGEVLRAGLEAVEVGLLPPTADGLILGTMQRSRVGRIKALVVVGANDGLLPAETGGESLLSEDEKAFLLSGEIEICRRDDLRVREENLAIYRNLAKPLRYLFMSHAISDAEGNKLTPSRIFEKMTEIFPQLPVRQDVCSEGRAMSLIQAKGSSLLHLTETMRKAMDQEEEPCIEWQAAADWHRRNNENAFVTMKDGLMYSGQRKNLSGNLTGVLYQGEGKSLSVSPSRLERYARCPFAHLVNYGLRPEELRVFEIAGREIGDVYHNCLMRFSMALSEPGKEVTAANSRWMTVTREECERLVSEIIDSEAGTYREGVLSQGEEENYRTRRMKKVCCDAAFLLVDHVRCGQIQDISFELPFGRKHPDGQESLPPLEVALSGGQKVFIEGKIDRVDVLSDGSIKIIDYKSGKERFNLEEARAGYRLQLLLYLAAAQREKAEPAGVFYFLIDEQRENERMDGICVDKPSVIDSIAGAFEKYSNVIPLRKLANGEIKGAGQGNLLTEEEFAELQEAVGGRVRELCEQLLEGCVETRPFRSGPTSACTYCAYGSICRFDLKFDGCRYVKV